MKHPTVGRGNLYSSSRKEDRASSEGWGCHPTVTSLTHNCSCLKELQDGNGEEPEEKKVQQWAQSGIQLKGRTQGLIQRLRLWNVHKKGPIMTAL